MEKAGPSNNYHYNPELKVRARQLRQQMNKAEASMWKYLLRAGQMRGYTFLRQRSVLDFIVDFMCKELLLVIEVDGITHETEVTALNDRLRDRRLESVGFTVMRFSNWEVLNRITAVSEILNEWIIERENKLDM